MKIDCLVVGELEENCYILRKNNHVIIIDPGSDGKRIIQEVGDDVVDGILITHYHFDHIGALTMLEEYYHVKANDRIKGFNYEIIDNPGHTLDSKSFYFPEINSIFVGDFIFDGGIGRCDLGGDWSLMKKSIKMFLNRFTNEKLYPGHGGTTTVDDERRLLEYYLNVSE